MKAKYKSKEPVINAFQYFGQLSPDLIDFLNDFGIKFLIDRTNSYNLSPLLKVKTFYEDGNKGAESGMKKVDKLDYIVYIKSPEKVELSVMNHKEFDNKFDTI